MASLFYKRTVIEGKGLLFFSALVAVLTRLQACFSTQIHIPLSGFFEGCLWYIVAPIFANKYISVASSFLSIIIIAFLLSYINAKHMIIRQKSFLPAAISLLLFSIHPSFMLMGAHYIGVIFVLLAFSILFTSYHETKGQIASVKIGFLLAICSLFFFNIFLYVLIFIIGMLYVRILSFKSLLAFFLGFALTYIIAFTCYFFSGNLGAFAHPFISCVKTTINFLPLFSYSLTDWIQFGFGFFVMMVFIINSYMNSFKDKIKIREFLQYLSMFCIYSTLLMLLININPAENISLILITASILYAHLFVLSDRKGIHFLFYVSIIFYLFFVVKNFIFN